MLREQSYAEWCPYGSALSTASPRHDQRLLSGPLRRSRTPGDFSMTPFVNTVVVGGGQAGLAVSHYLTDYAINHVVL
jgi:hypothetical protein